MRTLAILMALGTAGCGATGGHWVPGRPTSPAAWVKCSAKAAQDQLVCDQAHPDPNTCAAAIIKAGLDLAACVPDPVWVPDAPAAALSSCPPCPSCTNPSR